MSNVNRNQKESEMMYQLMEATNLNNTTEKRTDAFERWVSLKVKALETILNADIAVMNGWLNSGEIVHGEVFENMFKCLYASVNEVVEDINGLGIDAKIPVSTVRSAMDDLRKTKVKVRRVKADYKKRFNELHELICEAKKDAVYVKGISEMLASIVHQWCDLHELLPCWEDSFTGDKLSDNVAQFADSLLSTKLNPSEGDMRQFVESNMKWRSVKSA